MLTTILICHLCFILQQINICPPTKDVLFICCVCDACINFFHEYFLTGCSKSSGGKVPCRNHPGNIHRLFSLMLWLSVFILFSYCLSCPYFSFSHTCNCVIALAFTVFLTLVFPFELFSLLTLLSSFALWLWLCSLAVSNTSAR